MSDYIQPDVINNLPLDVLGKIVECLPLRDAARTSVLSHKWNRTWTSIPSLIFDDQFFLTVLKLKMRSTHDFCATITKVLLQHEGPINKFFMSVTLLRDIPDVSQWMTYLSRNGIRDFTLMNYHFGSIEISSLVYTCRGLEKLKLQGCTFSSLSNFRGLPKLTSLELEKVNIEYNRLNDLIRKCPVLEKLALINCVGVVHRHLIVDAPNLTYLAAHGAFDSLEIKNGENLVSASIVMHKSPEVSAKACCDDLIKLFQSSSKLEMLSLGGHLCKVIFKQGCLSNVFEKVRILELISLHLDDPDDLLTTINCIRSIPNIERLKISVHTTKNVDDKVDYNPKWTLNHLSSAIVDILKASSIELKLIEYVLGCSPLLENLSVSFTKSIKHDTYKRKLVQLNQLNRVSPMVNVAYSCFAFKIPRKIYLGSSDSSLECYSSSNSDSS